MARKARLTVFSRFIIMMLVVGPLAFLGASYYNGEDGVATIKDLFSKGSKESTTETRTNRTAPSSTEADDNSTYKIRKLEEELEYKQKRLDEMYKENEALKQKVDELEQEVSKRTTSTSSSSSGGSSSSYNGKSSSSSSSSKSN